MPRLAKQSAEFEERVTLPPRLDEFRTALEEEVKTAQREGSNETLLTGGRFQAAVAGEFLYDFDTALPVRVPPDTPGELILEGSETKISVTLVHLNELTVTIASPVNLGRSLRTARLRTNLTMLLRRLIDRIEQKGVHRWDAAERMLNGGPVAGEPLPLSRNYDLNQEQRWAVQNALGRNLTFIWGPPGTGKTQTIGSLGCELFERGQSLLLVSHTNVAVDEALCRIASLCEGNFVEGEIIRVGEPVKSEMRARTNLICRDIATRRSEALRQQQARLQAERQSGWDRLKELERLITIVEWANEAGADIQRLQQAWGQVLKLEEQARSLDAQLVEAAAEQPLWHERKLATAEAHLCIERQRELTRTLIGVKGRRNLLVSTLTNLENSQGEAERLLALALEAEPLRQRRTVLPSSDDLRARVEQAGQEMASWSQVRVAAGSELTRSMALLEESQRTGKLRRLWQRLPDPKDQAEVVAKVRHELEVARRALDRAVNAKADAAALAREVAALDDRLARFIDVPGLAEQERAYAKLRVRHATILHEIADCDQHLRQGEEAARRCNDSLLAFSQTYGGDPDEVAKQIDAFARRTSQLRTQRQTTATLARSMKLDLETKLVTLLGVLEQVGLSNTDGASCHEMLEAVGEAYARALQEARRHPYERLTAERRELSERMASITDEISAIDDQLTRVEQNIILNARIIATTLTRAFMRDVFHQRQFDTVLCDEASMAPLPALWTAATLATRAVVAVGDFLQLSPIVQSDHLLAERWLGRDIFEVSGVQAAHEQKRRPPFFVALRRQFRMHPAIADVPNELIYDRSLVNDESVSAPRADEKLLLWYAGEWGFDRPLLMVDTSSAGGWNNKAGNSRLNFLTAVLAVRIVRAVLRPARLPLGEAEGRRIFMISPYRPQASLINLLLKEEGIGAEVQASTAHSCQGGEADFVVLDLTVDEPHFLTSLTIKTAAADTRRLLNVAMTRAKRRLIIIGNFAWLQRKGRGGFVGGELLPYLLSKHRPVTAGELFGRTSVGAASRTIAGTDALEELGRVLDAAKQQIIIMSPAVSAVALTTLMPRLAVACSRGVSVALIVRPLCEQDASVKSKLPEIEAQIRELRGAGVAVVFKSGMHEKLLLADKREVWIATFGPLDAECRGIAEARGTLASEKRLRLCEEVVDCLGIEHVLTAVREEQLQCPVCGAEMWIADTGRKSDEPFYWRCARDDCYSRRLKDPPIVQGMVVFACGGRPTLDYWSDSPVWLCDCGRRHRCRIRKVHVRLPRMWALVPKHRRNRLLRELGLNPEDDPVRQANVVSDEDDLLRL